MENATEIVKHEAMHREMFVTLSPSAVADAFEKFLRLSVADGSASPRTIKAYREGIAVFFAWCARPEINLDPKAATFEQIQEYRKHLAGIYARSTCQLRLLAVRVLYQALQRWGIRKDNPADGIRAAKDRTDRMAKVLEKALTPAETGNLLSVLPALATIAGARDHAIMMLMLFHGLRCEEIANLKIQDLDTNAFTWLWVSGKGSKRRKIFLIHWTRTAMIAWAERRGTGRLWDTSDPAYLFHALEDPCAKPISVRTIQRIADKYLKAAGLKREGRGAHSLRHTYAILAIQGGAEREALGDSMGHVNLSTTDIYIRAAGQLQGNPAEAAAAALEGKRFDARDSKGDQ